MKKSLVAASLMGLSFSASSAVQTAELTVPTMNCPVCPITIKAALSKVDGVEQVKTSLGEKKAWVAFDDEKTSVESLELVSAKAGYLPRES